jgi:oxygen-independent coproporphyrinogen III oxidase
MNGIYIHIPFCKKLCFYCDFHFTVSLKQKDKVVEAIAREIVLRKDYLHSSTLSTGTELNTIYFGGGTPSILNVRQVESFLNVIAQNFSIAKDAEITLEANPDDLNSQYLSDLKKVGINRLSIGVQSFFDEDLLWMNRRHTGAEAERSIKLSQDAGFHNLNLDLIYGLPQLSLPRWEENLAKFFTLDVPHLSAYHLSIEPKTVLGYYKRKGKLTEIGEDQSLEHYQSLIAATRAKGYEHYEVSNFCKQGFYSRHNSNYWKKGHYLGVGPSAHSYNGDSRQWNVSVNTAYMNAVNDGKPFCEIENLSETDKFNDYLLTGLRTSWGIALEDIKVNYDPKYFRHLQSELKKQEGSGLLEITPTSVKFSDAGMFISDRIISEFFFTD